MSAVESSAVWPAMSIDQANAILTAPGMPAEIVTAIVGGRETPVWKNTPPTLGAVVQATRGHGARVFLVNDDERVTYEAFYRVVSALSRELLAQGVAKGDRVAVVMRNLPEWVAAFYAATAIGAVVTPLNAWWTGEELEYGLVDSGAKILILDAERYERLSGHLSRCPDLARVYVCRSLEEIADPRVAKLEGVIGSPRDWSGLPDQALPAALVDTDDDATIFYTSGTTGRPKGTLSTHRNVNTSIITGAVSAARSALRRGESPQTPDPSVQRSVLIPVPFFHVTGCMAILNPMFAAGGKLVMLRKWDVVRAMELIEQEKIMGVSGVPTIAWQLIEHPLRENYDLSSLEALAYGGAPSASELVRKIKEAFPKSMASNGWGMTETTGVVTGHTAEDYVNRPESCGPAVPVSQLQIRDPADGVTVLAPGALGELWVNGPQIAKLYWNKPQATAETFVDGWVRTGDLARVDEEGFCFIVDRAKDMLIRGGENIYCIEVENILYEHPAVMDAAVVGIPHRILGEEPAAVVTLKPGGSASEVELRAYVAKRLAAFKVPVAVLFSDEILPRNANGKILKSELRKLFADAPVKA
jgi:long-chain acyl-CoA synthetase